MNTNILDMETLAIDEEERALVIIDQTKLPNKAEYLHLKTQGEIWTAIRELQVRGAPAIVYELSILGCKEGYVPVAPYGRPGTRAAAENVLAPLTISDVALMQAHGVVAVAGSLKEALLKASYVEELADIYYRCLTVLGREPDTIPADELAKWKYPTV